MATAKRIKVTVEIDGKSYTAVGEATAKGRPFVPALFVWNAVQRLTKSAWEGLYPTPAPVPQEGEAR